MTDKTEAMDNLIAQDADLIDTVTERVAEVTQADRDAAKAAVFATSLPEAFARHRQYGYDQGYYDGRKMDGMEERAKIVAWCRNVNIYWCKCAYAIEEGEHLQEQSK